ncbi:MAG: carbohydrate kinase family protein [Candidatus Micrarchaeota archaeon]
MAPSLDVICVGHLVYDIRDYVEDFPQADKTVFLRRPPAISAGGSAANAALNAVRLGHSAGLVSNVGDDPHGRFLLAELAREGIHSPHVKLVKGGRTGLSIVLIDKNGEVMVVEDTGCVDAKRRLPADYIASARWVHLSGCSYDWMLQTAKAAHDGGKPLSVDPGRAASRLGMKKLAPVLEKTDLLILNRKELLALTGSSALEEVRRLSKKFDCSVVLKTGHGPAVCSASGAAAFEVPPFNASEVVDTIGAGDAFDAGVICGKLERKPLYEAVRLGHACAAAKVMHAGAQSMPKRAVVKKHFKF